MYDLKKINQLLDRNGLLATGKIKQFASIDSTNHWLLQQSECHGVVCLAAHQTAGQGRQGHSWIDTSGGSILLSFGWQAKRKLSSATALMIGVVVAQTLKKAGLANVQLKWPNDILYADKKLGGILVQTVGHKCVVGIGINVNMDSSDGNSIEQPWINLNQLGFVFDCEHLIAGLISGLCAAFQQYECSGMASFIEQWSYYHAWQGCHVKVGDKRNGLCGIVLGIASDGALLLRSGESIKRVVGGNVRRCEELSQVTLEVG